MHLKFKAGLSGPDYSFAPGDALPIDDTLPFSADEVERLVAADFAEIVGEAAPKRATTSAPTPAPTSAPAPKPAAKKKA